MTSYHNRKVSSLSLGILSHITDVRLKFTSIFFSHAARQDNEEEKKNKEMKKIKMILYSNKKRFNRHLKRLIFRMMK
jgi:hypothetical protein